MGAIRPRALDVGGYIGELKASVRVVDGVVDNGVDYENVTLINNSTSDGESITLIGVTGSNANASILAPNIKAGETYTTFIEVTATTFEGPLIIKDSGGVSNADYTIPNEDVVGITYVTWVAEDPIVNTDILFNATGNPSGEDVTFKHLATYLGTLTDISQVNQGEPVSGNSLINVTTKKSVTDADKLTTVQMFNHDDEDNIYPLVVPVDDFIADDSDVRFTKFDVNGGIDKQGLYSEALVSPCLEEVQDFFDIHIPYRVYNDVTGEYDAYVTDGLIYNVKAGS